MGVFNGLFPIQAGKEEDARAFAAETVGARLAGYEAHHARVGITKLVPPPEVLFDWHA